MIDKKQPFFNMILSFLKGIGQIMLQNNFWTGLLFLAGIFFGSYTMGFAAIIAVITGTLTAKLLKYNEDEINSGLYGFSATLVGVALIFLYQPTVIIWLAVLLGSALATIIQHIFIVKKIPAFTFPFILVTWLLLLIFHYFPFLTELQPITAGAHQNNLLTVFSGGFGQIIFQDSVWAGILFFAGVFISRPVAAIYAVAAIIISGVIAYWSGEPIKDIYMGLLSYNAVLCAITFAGRKPKDGMLAFLSVVISVLVMIQMRKMNLPALTFPFVLASWLVLLIKNTKLAGLLKMKARDQ